MAFTQRETNAMGMPLTEWKHEACTALVATGGSVRPWATVYLIETADGARRRGYATALLRHLQGVYHDRVFGCTVALNPALRRILRRLRIVEYDMRSDDMHVLEEDAASAADELDAAFEQLLGSIDIAPAASSDMSACSACN